MKQVDFYLISNRVVDAKYKLAGRLANKLQRLEQRSLLVTSDQTECARLDEVLWSFSDTSFVAHEQISDGDRQSKVTIADHENVSAKGLEDNYDVLINLGDTVPVFSHHFARIAEIVDSDDASKQAARLRYKDYQSQGFELKTHDIAL